jgi:hypothetical protein
MYFNEVDLAWGVGMDLDRRAVFTYHFKKKKIHLQLLSKKSQIAKLLMLYNDLLMFISIGYSYSL